MHDGDLLDLVFREDLFGDLVQRRHGEGRVGRVGERGDGLVVERVAGCADEEDGSACGGRPDEGCCWDGGEGVWVSSMWIVGVVFVIGSEGRLGSGSVVVVVVVAMFDISCLFYFFSKK